MNDSMIYVNTRNLNRFSSLMYWIVSLCCGIQVICHLLLLIGPCGDAGDGLAGMKQGDLIIWYVEQQNAKGAYSSTAEVKEEVKCIKAIIEVSPAVISILSAF